VSTAPKMKPAKAAGKLNPLPAVVGAPCETAQRQTEANDQSLATVLHASGNLREKWRVSAKPVQTLRYSKTFKSLRHRAAELVSQQLRVEVTSLLETFRKKSFKNTEDFEEAPEWRRVNGLFRGYGEKYARASCGDLAWAKEQIRSDGDAIYKQNARFFGLVQDRYSDFGREYTRGVLKDKLDFAMAEGMAEAGVFLAESEPPHRNGRPAGRQLGSDDSHSESTRQLAAHVRAPLPAYRSPVKRAFMSVLLHAKAPNDLSNLQLCLADEAGALPPDDWQTANLITFESAYKKKSTAIHSAANKVKTDLRGRGLIPVPDRTRPPDPLLTSTNQPLTTHTNLAPSKAVPGAARQPSWKKHSPQPLR
jgi:hypothetical protein